MDARTRRGPGRFLAPLALIAVVVVVVMIVNGSGSGSGSSTTVDSGTPATSTTSATKTSTGSKTSTKKAVVVSKSYTVQVGDTFGGIADKTGVPIERLQELNPAVDAHAMTVGQKLKLK
jgi:LysM repeat protein